MPSATSLKILAAVVLLALLSAGCSATYVPISWNFQRQVQELSRSDLTLSIFYQHYDPERKTLRGSGKSFDEVMMPSEVKYHLGAYRPDTRLIYRNLYQTYSDRELRDLMVHEFSHHIWFVFMTKPQRDQWGEHLEKNPSPLQAMVRQVYQDKPADFSTEDFAFTMEYPRSVDIQELARLGLISSEERDSILAELKPSHGPVTRQGGFPTGSELSEAGPVPSDKGKNTAL